MQIFEKHVYWIAAYLDAEGTIAFNKSKNPRVVRGFIWIPKITIDNTSKEAMDTVLRLTGFGHIRTLDRYGYEEKPLYRYELLTYKEIVDFLLVIKDVLVTKKRQAECLLEAIGLLMSYHGARQNPERTRIRDHRLEAIWMDMRVLNAKRKKIQEAIDLRNSVPPYSREQFEADMKAFEETYHPNYLKLEYQREKLRQWRANHPDQYREQQRKYNERRKQLSSPAPQ